MAEIFFNSTPESELKSPFQKILAYLKLRIRRFLLAIILLELLIAALITRPPIASTRPPNISPQQPKPISGDCHSGLIYVYDLPPLFNSDLFNDCHLLDPWRSVCDSFLNNGLGRKAHELAGVVPQNLAPMWYWTDHYMGEVVYHHRMLNYKCRTLDPEKATAFYIPFYVGLAVGKYLWGNHTAKERDWHCEMMFKWVQNHPWWKRSNGSDHFLMVGRLTWDFRRLTDSDEEWGSSFLVMPEMKNVIRLSVERNLWDSLELAVPYPTIFHPRSKSDVSEWQSFVRGRNRTNLFTLVAATRKKITNDFRGLLLNQCLNATSDKCLFIDCAKSHCVEGTSVILEAFMGSEFCLQPKGDGFTRRSVFDCMIAGSIPVFFWKQTAYEQYEWFMPDDPGSYSVYIDRNEVRKGKSIKEVLESYSRERVEKMREKVIEWIPRFLYGEGDGGIDGLSDAFEIAINGMLKKYKNHIRRRENENGSD
ncbi:xyloglucan galactosyltransferase XLT2-like [Impatiens glandulifera]|uniref:xyloglucan galactosyltransferase XLT2-like n=1 Tax=Impatiens glandulifera TaxID=253017 RepID=UPI001FB16BF4|nr:xyloglucan galactosyltransferase XLT2-like [Impatiens glandulifera]